MIRFFLHFILFEKHRHFQYRTRGRETTGIKIIRNHHLYLFQEFFSHFENRRLLKKFPVYVKNLPTPPSSYRLAS